MEGEADDINLAIPASIKIVSLDALVSNKSSSTVSPLKVFRISLDRPRKVREKKREKKGKMRKTLGRKSHKLN